ncbi:MAG: type II secretion system minor pseudopilin GspK [Burkholderiales bacterium]|nr:type II secretion system minor pseudopilin GspK [Burkholderiales bacterium]
MKRGPQRHQRGAALLTAMIIVVLIVTLASSMVWQQWRAVQVEVAERARTQSAWILSGALDWARLILREDARGQVDHLGEPWAVPLAEARLSTFLAADSNNTDDGPEAFLSGSIIDAQSHYNVTNLVDRSKGIIDPFEFAAFERLCQNLGVDASVTTLIASGLRDALAPAGNGSASAPLLPESVAQLGWLGVDAASLELLAPYIVILPVATPVNVNTASAEVLVAVIPGNDHATAERLLQVRQRTPFEDLTKFWAQVPALAPKAGATAPQAKLSVNSAFFEVRGRLRLSDRVLEESSLVQRMQGRQVDVLRRERVASREDTAPAN